MNTNIDKFNELGYLLVENVFSKEEISIFNEKVKTFVKENPTMPNASEISIPDFISNQKII